MPTCQRPPSSQSLAPLLEAEEDRGGRARQQLPSPLVAGEEGGGRAQQQQLPPPLLAGEEKGGHALQQLPSSPLMACKEEEGGLALQHQPASSPAGGVGSLSRPASVAPPLVSWGGQSPRDGHTQQSAPLARSASGSQFLPPPLLPLRDVTAAEVRAIAAAAAAAAAAVNPPPYLGHAPHASMVSPPLGRGSTKRPSGILRREGFYYPPLSSAAPQQQSLTAAATRKRPLTKAAPQQPCAAAGAVAPSSEERLGDEESDEEGDDDEGADEEAIQPIAKLGKRKVSTYEPYQEGTEMSAQATQCSLNVLSSCWSLPPTRRGSLGGLSCWAGF